jgi:hypothetical protein
LLRHKNNLLAVLDKQGRDVAWLAARTRSSHGHLTKVARGNVRASRRLQAAIAMTLGVPLAEVFPAAHPSLEAADAS